MPLQLLDGQSHAALAACDVTLIASGTATLEAALFKRPMVIGYRMHPLSWQLMKRMRYQPWVGLPNILCRDFVVPELLQGDCTPEALAAAVLAGLDDAAGAARIAQRFTELHHLLQARHRALRHRCHRASPRRLNSSAWTGPSRRARAVPGGCAACGACRRWSRASTKPAAARWPGRWWRRR